MALAACFLFLITKIAPSKNTLCLLALDFVFSSSQVDSHKQEDNETKMLHIKFPRLQVQVFLNQVGTTFILGLRQGQCYLGKQV